jgi:hypothetical protein
VNRHKIEIDVDGVGRGTITLDGHDVSGAVRGVRLSAEVGSVTEVELDLRLGYAQKVSGSEVQVIIPGDTARALHVLGWTAPDGTTPAYVHALLDAFLTGKTLDFAGATVPADVQARLVAVRQVIVNG